MQESFNPHQFDASSPQDDFLDQMLSAIPSYGGWPPQPHLPPQQPPPPSSNSNQSLEIDDQQFHQPYDESLLASKLRQNQISGSPSTAGKPPSLTAIQQHLLLSRGISGADSALLQLPLGLAGAAANTSINDSRLLVDRSRNDLLDASSFKSPDNEGDGSVQALYSNGFAGSLHGSNGHASNQSNNFNHHPQAQNFGAQAVAGGTQGQPKQRVRARRGQATDPHSIAERLRRERIAERMKALQELVPNANKTDKASMLDEIIDYVKFLQLQVKVLSMSRLGGAAAVAPLVADRSSEGGAGGDCTQGGPSGGANGRSINRGSNGDCLTVTEQQVAKLMEEDMGSAMQYLQGKGLCLMPISLATAISTATCHPSSVATAARNYPHPLFHANANANANAADGPSSPSVSVLTVQSATAAINGTGAAADASVSKP